MRALLALSALVIIYIDPSEPSRLVATTYVSLAIYSAYSLALSIATFYGQAFVPRRAQHWVDVAFYACLIALSAGTNSIFFQFFFFAILVASFSYGFGEGIAVMVVSLLLFGLVGVAAAPTGEEFELNRALIRPASLFMLGYLMAYWGGKEVTLRRRLALLRELAGCTNPRDGMDRAAASCLHLLGRFFGAAECILVWSRAGTNTFAIHRAPALGDERPASALDEHAARALLDLPAGAVSWDARRPAADAAAMRGRRVANLLEADAFVSVPCAQKDRLQGRLYVLARGGRLRGADPDFLAQVAAQMLSALDNVALLEQLMASAAEVERSKISRDIHDTTIQPYIGLRLGLEAAHRKLEPGSPAAAAIKELVDMSALVIEDLRRYVNRLRGKETWAAPQLLSAVATQAERFRSFYGIEVALEADKSLHLTDKLATEVYQLLCEGLSNIYRHTRARRALIRIAHEAHDLRVEIANERDPGRAPDRFLPRAIAERAAAMGGTTEMRSQRERDIVCVRIPYEQKVISEAT